MELTLNIDEHGRTAPPPDKAVNILSSLLDYTTKTTHFDNINDEIICDTIIRDCKETTFEDLPLTFWLSAQDTPRCLLEQLARDIFMHHLNRPQAEGLDYNDLSSDSGCEWWVQLRPSPNQKRINSQSQEAQRGIEFHWDKDERLRDATGIFIHPHLSTVTYLTNNGAPTMVFEDSVPDEGLIDRGLARAFLSWPCCGKHLSFDGRFLHGAPSGLLESENSNDIHKDLRVTFLVNIWLHHKPLGVEPFPESMLNRMTGIKDATKAIFPSKSESKKRRVTMRKNRHGFKWGMGTVSIHANMPMKVIREERLSDVNGHNVEIQWTPSNMAVVRANNSLSC